MAKKKVDKQIKRLKKRARQATAAKLKLEKRVRKLETRLAAERQRVIDLAAGADQATAVSEGQDPRPAQFGDRDGASIVSSHRSAWKQHRYLRDRYEFHLNAGETSADARRRANQDLEQEYGEAHGYTEDELSAILS